MSILTVIKSTIDIIGGPATLLNNISSTAASYAEEVTLVVLTYTFADIFSEALLMLSLAA